MSESFGNLQYTLLHLITMVLTIEDLKADDSIKFAQKIHTNNKRKLNEVNNHGY